MHERYYESRKARIESDLASFADPGGVSVSGGKRRFLVEWTMRGESREATFTVSPDSGVTVHSDGETLPYGVFLAGTRMADLRHVAQMIVQTGSQEIFVPTRARLTDTDTPPASDPECPHREHVPQRARRTDTDTPRCPATEL